MFKTPATSGLSLRMCLVENLLQFLHCIVRVHLRSRETGVAQEILYGINLRTFVE